MGGGWLAASFQLLLSPEELGEDALSENPHCEGGGGPWSGCQSLVVSGGSDWRTLDLDQVKKEAKNLPPIPPLLNREEVDKYLENLDKALQELADKITRPLRDSKYTVPWWNQEIKEKIKKERKLRRKVFQNQEPVHKLEKVIKKKKYLIKNAKRKTFREQLQNLAETQKHWKIARWGEEKAGKPPELPIIPELTYYNPGGTQSLYTHREQQTGY